MSILTKFLKLVKPEKNDYVDVEKHISENYDKIDSQMEELSTSNDEKLDKGLVSEEYDTAKKIEDKIKTVQSIADNKLNKGSLPAKIPDAKAIYDLLENNGGINIDTELIYLNDEGTKTQGKVYFDRNKKGLFKCISQTTSTTNSTSYFVDISNEANFTQIKNNNFKKIGEIQVANQSLNVSQYNELIVLCYTSVGYMMLWRTLHLFKDAQPLISEIFHQNGTIELSLAYKNDTVTLTNQGNGNDGYIKIYGKK